MAKPKQKAVKTPKKRSTKYGKLAAVCTKELSAKKAALVRAEKAFAKAQKNHTELLAEVARLDMLDRSLKALINGTEPPQNVRYVYNYPQWVWHGNPYGWWWNGYTWTLNGQTGTFNNGNIQGGQFYNSVNTVNTTPSVQTINTVVGDAPVITTTSGSLLTSGSTCFNVNAGSNLIGHNSSGISLSSAGYGDALSLPSTSFTTTNAGINQSEFTVDLSTGALEEDKDVDVTESELLSVVKKLTD